MCRVSFVAGFEGYVRGCLYCYESLGGFGSLGLLGLRGFLRIYGIRWLLGLQ